MELKQKIESDLREAMKAREELRLSVLRMLSSAIHNREIDKRTRLARLAETSRGWASASAERAKTGTAELTEEEVVAVIRSEVKKRRDAIAEFTHGGRPELAEKENMESHILEHYLPQELTDEDIERTVREVLEELGAVGAKDFGRVMGEVMRRLKGQASGERVSICVRRVLGNE